MPYILNGTKELLELPVPDFYLRNEACSFATTFLGRSWSGGRYLQPLHDIIIGNGTAGGVRNVGKLCPASIWLGITGMLFSFALGLSFLLARQQLMMSKKRQKLLCKENRKLRSSSNRILSRLHHYRAQIKSYKKTHKDFEDMVRMIRNNHNMVIEENFHLRNERTELLTIRGLIDSDDMSSDDLET